MSESNGRSESEDMTPATGTEGGAEQMMREVMSQQDHQEDARERVRRLMDSANNKNAGREEEAPRIAMRNNEVVSRRTAEIREQQRVASDDPSDPSKPVIGTLDMIEEIVRATQRFGSLAHWPNEKKTEILGLVSRTVKQLQIAEQVIAVARRDNVHARAYRERKKLAREAASLVRAYLLDPNGDQTRISSGEISTESDHYAEVVNMLGAFVRRVADMQKVQGDEEE